MRRRTALTATASALAGLTGLAGCLGAPESPTTDETETTTTEQSAGSTTRSGTDQPAAPSLGYGGEDPTVEARRLRTEVRPLTRTFVVEYAETRTPKPK
jgi:hypothetical protein